MRIERMPRTGFDTPGRIGIPCGASHGIGVPGHPEHLGRSRRQENVARAVPAQRPERLERAVRAPL